MCFLGERRDGVGGVFEGEARPGGLAESSSLFPLGLQRKRVLLVHAHPSNSTNGLQASNSASHEATVAAM